MTDSIAEAKHAGRVAVIMGVSWCAGLLALYAVNAAVLHHRSFLLLPVFGLLAIYLVVGGAIQAATGKGGIERRKTLPPGRLIVVQFGLFLLLGLIQHLATS